MVNTQKLPPSVRLSIGEPIQHLSELECLNKIYEALVRSGEWAHIFANFHVGGRQVDLVVFTERTTAVIEAKCYRHPVLGGANGQWEQLGPYGAKKVGNAYLQAWNAKLALRDQIQREHPTDGYPNAMVIVTPNIPSGSKMVSDFKVTIKGLAALEHELSRPSDMRLTSLASDDLARQLGLETVTSVAAATDPDCLDLERMFNRYVESFRMFYIPLAEPLVGDKYLCNEAELGLEEAKSIVTSSNSSMLILGPSGCGKSLLAISCAISSLQSGDIPLFVAGRNFDGDFQKLLDKEVALLGGASARSLVRAAKFLNKKIALFLDGYNECPPNLQLSLTRSLRAFAIRHGASIVVSSQHEVAAQTLLSTQTLLVSRPSAKLKADLAGLQFLVDDTDSLRSLLDVANSGLEAALIGHVGAQLQAGASRFRLFDTYARTRLGLSATEGVRLLSSFADTLSTRACFSLSIREFDRLCDAEKLTHLGRANLLTSGLLDFRGDRVSFIHELFFSAYSAEAVMRATRDDLPKMLAALASPRYNSAKKFIVGALEDYALLEMVIDETVDQEIVNACSTGECGGMAKSIISRKISAMLDEMVLESDGLDFRINGEGWHAVEISTTTSHKRLANFDAYLAAVGDALMNGHHLQTILSACRLVDKSIARFTNANVDEAKIKKIPLKSDTFSAAFVMHCGAAISKLVNFVHSGGLAFRRNEGPGLAPALLNAWQGARTPGEYYFLIGLTRLTKQDIPIAPHIVGLLNNLRFHPYHLQLDLIDFSSYFRDLNECYRRQIIDVLQAALNKFGAMMNTVIFEALSRLGALDEEAESHIPVIREEIALALRCDNEQADADAWGIFSRQYDHPFDSAYWDEVQGLDETDRKRLFTKACRGAQAPYVSFVAILIRELAEFNDPSVAQEIMRWTSLPDKKSSMPQDAIEVFISAHEALGRLGAELPPSQQEKAEADRALLACGRLFYWASRADVRNVETSANTLDARTTLEQSSQSGAGLLQITASWMRSADGTRESLVRKYPNVAVRVCRNALACREALVSYFPNGFNSDQSSIARFAINVLGEFGTQTDTTILRALCDHKALGTASLGAIKNIEERLR